VGQFLLSCAVFFLCLLQTPTPPFIVQGAATDSICIQAVEEKYDVLKKEFDEVNSKFENASKDIEQLKDANKKANADISGYQKMADDANKKMAAAKEFLDKHDEFQREMDRLKDFERMYESARRESEDLKQDMEAQTVKNDALKHGGDAAPDSDTLAGMGAKSRRGRAATKGNGKYTGSGPLQRAHSIGNSTHVLGPWVKKAILTVGVEGQDDVASKLVLVRMLTKLGEKKSEDVSISGRIAHFMTAAAQHFQKASAADGPTIDQAAAESAMRSVGMRKEYVQQALQVVTQKQGPWLDKNAFADALATAQSLAAWHKIDVGRKGFASNGDVITFLEGCGYQSDDCEEFILRADPEQNGTITSQRWVDEWNRHLGTRMDVQMPAMPATAVAHVAAQGVSATKMFRNAANSIVFTRGKPTAGTQTSNAEAQGRNAQDSSFAGGGQIGLQPSPMGRMLEIKDLQIETAEANYEAAVEQIGQLLAFIKARCDHHETQVRSMRGQLHLLSQLKQTSHVTQGTCTSPYVAPQGAGLVSQQLQDPQDLDPFPPFSEMYKRGCAVSVQVKHARTKLKDIVRDFHPGSEPTMSRSIVWLAKMLHGMLASKMVCDAADISMDLPMSSYAAFCADWMRNRFGVEALVRKGCLELDASLQVHRQHSLFVEVLASFFEGKHGSAEQRAFLHCYSLVGDVMDRRRQPRDSAMPRELTLDVALDISGRVLPYASALERTRLKDSLLAVCSDTVLGDRGVRQCKTHIVLCRLLRPGVKNLRAL